MSAEGFWDGLLILQVISQEKWPEDLKPGPLQGLFWLEQGNLPKLCYHTSSFFRVGLQ
jgi:hypothetical protein